MPTKEVIRETAIDFAKDRGYIFWTLVYLLFIPFIGLFEQIFYQGLIFEWITHSKFIFLVTAFITGSVLDFIIKANVEVTAVRNKFIFKPPIYLRRFRLWTNVSVVLGLALAGYSYWLASSFTSVLPIMTFVTSFVICLAWSVLGLFLTEKDLEDKRIRYFFQEMRVERSRRLNRAAVIYFSGMTISSIIFYKLIKISGLWWWIENSRIYYDITKFLKDYFSWTHKFVG